jgi:hypothetical protein
MGETALSKIESRPAREEMIEYLAQAFLDYRSHDHPESGEDLYCLNLTSFMGERMGMVLARLREEMNKREGA